MTGAIPFWSLSATSGTLFASLRVLIVSSNTHLSCIGFEYDARLRRALSIGTSFFLARVLLQFHAECAGFTSQCYQYICFCWLPAELVHCMDIPTNLPQRTSLCNATGASSLIVIPRRVSWRRNVGEPESRDGNRTSVNRRGRTIARLQNIMIRNMWSIRQWRENLRKTRCT